MSVWHTPVTVFWLCSKGDDRVNVSRADALIQDGNLCLLGLTVSGNNIGVTGYIRFLLS